MALLMVLDSTDKRYGRNSSSAMVSSLSAVSFVLAISACVAITLSLLLDIRQHISFNCNLYSFNCNYFAGNRGGTA